MTNELAIIFLFGSPFLAILGGIVAGIMKTRGEQRLRELAQRERILAIEKGLDLSRFPYGEVMSDPLTAARMAGVRRVQGLLIGGLVSIAIGIGLPMMLAFMPAHDGGDAWPVGFVPLFIGIALLIASRAVRKTLDQLLPPAGV